MALRTVKGMKEIEKEQKVAEAKGKGGGLFLIIGGGESRKIFFLTEPEQAVGFWEHRFQDPASGNWQYLPCQSDDCPLCTSDDELLTKTSYRVAYVVMPSDERKAYILKANTDLNGRIIIRFDNRKTLMDRPYIVSRTGKGIDTSYDVDSVEEKANLPADVLKKLEVGDPVKFIEDALQAKLDSYFGPDASSSSEVIDQAWDPEPEEQAGDSPQGISQSTETSELSPGEDW